MMEETKHTENKRRENGMKEEKVLKTVSRVLSTIFSPFMVPTISFLLLFLFTYLAFMPLIYKGIILGSVFLCTICLPLLLIYLYQRFCGQGMKELKERKKRFAPYALTATSYCICAIILYRLYAPHHLSAIIITCVLCMMVCGLLNLFWKISVHAASCGIIIGILLPYSIIFNFNPLGWLCGFILMSGLIGTARLILQQNTLFEVILGFVIGMFCGINGILFI
jgi:hypothetical protein